MARLHLNGIRLLAACLCMVFWQGPLVGDIVETGPFTGDKSEDFSGFGFGGGGFLTVDIFGGSVTLNALTVGGSVKMEASSTLIVGGQSDTVIPRSPFIMMGQLTVMEWVFNDPIEKLGGYFENNSFEDDVTFEFFDQQDNLIDTKIGSTPWALDTWTWNGWESDVPIYRAVSTGNNATLLNGFVWYDDLEISFAQVVPEPGQVTLLSLLLIGVAARRRNRRRT